MRLAAPPSIIGARAGGSIPGTSKSSAKPNAGTAPRKFRRDRRSRTGRSVMKNSTAVSTIPKAQATGRFKIVTEARVNTIEVDKNGRVAGVIYIKDGREYFQPADVVLLATYTYENVRTLLLSKSPAYPKGLSNNHGQVGKHYFSHNQTAGVTALFPFNINTWYGTPSQGVAADDWADDNFDHSGLDFIGGGNLWVYSDRRPIGAVNMSTFGRAPAWGSAWKSFVKHNADRWNIAYLQKTTLPFEDNTLERQRRLLE